MDVFVLDRQLVCAVTLPNQGQILATWSVYDLDSKKVAWGYSKGNDQLGGGCIPIAMSYAKRAARRILQKREHSTSKVARQSCLKLRESSP